MRRRFLAVSLSAAAVALTLSPSTAHADNRPAQGTQSGVSTAAESASVKEIRAHWTPERMRQALRNDLALPKSSQGAERSSSRSGIPPKAGARSAHAASPSTTSTTSTQFMTSAAAADEISVAQEVPYTTAPQYALVGRLFFDDPTGAPHTCSASSIVANNKNTLWTAGHCIHMGDGTGDAGWMKNFMYIPGYRDGNGPLGAWAVKTKITPNSWMESGDLKGSDYAALVLDPHPTHGNLQDRVGAFGYLFASNVTDYSDVYSAGYPGKGYNRTDFTGERMMFCYGNTVDAGPWNPLDDRLSMDCDMGEGSSGGSMVHGKNSTNPQIVGAISHHEADGNGNRISNDQFSSIHDSQAGNVIDAANAA